MERKTTILMKIAAPVMGIIIAGSTALTPVSALAAGSVKGELNGFQCSGYVTIDTREASAVTSFSRGGDIRAYVTLYAKIGNKTKIHNGSNYSNGGGTRAVAEVDSGIELTQYAEGKHSVSYDTYSWSDDTYIHY